MNAARTRFWQVVSVASLEGGWAVMLDEKPIRLPRGSALVVEGKTLAEAIAAEWAAITPKSAFRPDDLSLTRIAGTMIERIAPDQQAARAALLTIGLNDLLCYRAEGALGVQQRAAFDPWLAWMQAKHVRLTTTSSLSPVVQADETVSALEALLDGYGNADLAALGVAAQCGGSLVVALALIEGALTPQAALELCALDEMAQLKTWGHDAELADGIARQGADLADAARFASLAHCR